MKIPTVGEHPAGKPAKIDYIDYSEVCKDQKKVARVFGPTWLWIKTRQTNLAFGLCFWAQAGCKLWVSRVLTIGHRIVLIDVPFGNLKLVVFELRFGLVCSSNVLDVFSSGFAMLSSTESSTSLLLHFERTKKNSSTSVLWVVFVEPKPLLHLKAFHLGQSHCPLHPNKQK